MSGHITRMSRGSSVGSSCEQADQHLAQHVDLPRRAVAGVHLHRAVVRGAAACARRRVGRGVGPRSCWSQPEQRVGRRRRRWSLVALGRSPSVRRSSRASRPSEPSRGWPHRGGRGVARARHRPLAGGRGRARPRASAEACGSHRWTSRSSPSAARSSHLGHRQPGVAEQGEPRRQVEVGAAGAQPRQRVRVPHVGRRSVDAVEEPTPQRGLPVQVVVEVAARAVGVVTRAPVGEQLRALDGVGGEEAGEPARHGVAAAGRARRPGHRARGGWRASSKPGSPSDVVDHLEQWPGQPVGGPRVVGVAVEQHRRPASGA